MKILIVGGGIAGLAVARALELQGFSADLIERRANVPQEGTGLYLPGNAARAVLALGLTDSIAGVAMPITTQRILDNRGKPLSITRTADVWSSCGPCLALPRAALHTALRESLRSTDLRFGTSITGIEQRGTKSLATFSDDASGEYDLVIGADGIHSQLRQHLFPDVRPSYTGNVCWRFITRDIVGVDGWAVMLGDGVSLLAIPIGGDQVYVYADMAVSESDAQRNLTELPQRALLDAFSAPLSPLITQMPDHTQVHLGRIEQVVMEEWVKGHVVLIGDAAHASSPSMAEGAAMAMEDALVLAETLATASNISEALVEYTRRRKPRVDWVQKQCAARDKMRGLPGWARIPLLKLAGNKLYKRSYTPLTEPI
ncbi:FAD-dependent monooxygenase [Stutzerimonas stutzeri]|uniref:FAD-dependent monooxygenase n=1 Tax=Stutzerimonas stutzeri TaxID=316 RepID=UPI001CFDDFDD|nr:FAD-dependent monooxygenase [Stutzerimonas stutzeri]